MWLGRIPVKCCFLAQKPTKLAPSSFLCPLPPPPPTHTRLDHSPGSLAFKTLSNLASKCLDSPTSYSSSTHSLLSVKLVLGIEPESHQASGSNCQFTGNTEDGGLIEWHHEAAEDAISQTQTMGNSIRQTTYVQQNNCEGKKMT